VPALQVRLALCLGDGRAGCPSNLLIIEMHDQMGSRLNYDMRNFLSSYARCAQRAASLY
jgi:hypothetical protein